MATHTPKPPVHTPAQPQPTNTPRPAPKPSKMAAIALMCAAVVGVSACAGTAAPPQLGPEAKVSFHVNEVDHAINNLIRVNHDAESVGAIKLEDARKVNDAGREALRESLVLNRALRASGMQSEEAKKAAAAIRSVLDDMVAKLSPETQQKLGTYIQTVLNLIEWLQTKGSALLFVFDEPIPAGGY